MFKKSLLAAALTLGFTGLATAADKTDQANAWTHKSWNATLKEMPQGDIQRGAELHRDGLCLTCHGAEGVAPSRNVPSLAGQQAAYTYKTLKDYKSKLRNEDLGRAWIMHAATEPMTEQEMADLAVYYEAQTLATTPARSSNQQVDRLVRVGDVNRMIVACASCHGAKGEGNGINPALAGQTYDYFKRTLLDYRDKARTNDIDEGMAMFTYQLTDTEIDALAEYYSSLRDD